MTSKYIFCQCMKPWKLCVNKQSSYKIDARGIIDIYNIKVPFIGDKRSDCYKRSEKIRDNCYNGSNKINYDFIKMRPTNTKFVCRFLHRIGNVQIQKSYQSRFRKSNRRSHYAIGKRRRIQYFCKIRRLRHAKRSFRKKSLWHVNGQGRRKIA